MNSNKMPAWLAVLLGVLGVAILGPPALVLVLVALGVALSVGVALLKVSVVAFGIALVVMALRAMFGGRRAAMPQPDRLASSASIDEIADRLEREEQERRAALDRQLDEAMRAQRVT